LLETALSMLLRATAAQQAARVARGMAGRLALRAVAAILAAICIFGALGCALAALWIYALPRTGPALAAAIVAVALLCIAGLLLLLARGRSRSVKEASSRETSAHSSPPGPLSELLRGDSSALLVAAILAGLLLGTKSSRGKKEP
jgi:hypothetical protein